MAETLLLLNVARTLKKPLDDIYELVKSKFKIRLERWTANKNVNELHKRISSIQKVKTIWQVEKEVNLKKFYYPSKLIINDTVQTISQIKKIPNEANVVIQGTVGQGKSILRYLCSQELRTGSKIPIFLELRKIQAGSTLKQHLFTVLDSWGFEIDDELFDFYADSGKFVFLLDGFDEIDPLLINSIVNEIDLFSEKYFNLQIIITSRPDSGIEKSAYFRVYNLAPLKKSDHEGILKKLIGNDEQERCVLEALRDSLTQINELLTTPLMMTLLVLVYKAEQKIPEQFSEFYENLFQTLLQRHDKSKPGYARAKSCPVNERKLQELFEAFCFLASKESLATMSFEKIHNLSNEAIQNTKIECDESSFIHDISKIACLIIVEGLDFHFIHKSVREYHSANFIKRRPDEFVVKFYQTMLQDSWGDWKQELNFLSQVDEYRFTRYFLIPLIESYFQENKINLTENFQKVDNFHIDTELKYVDIVLSGNPLELTSYMAGGKTPFSEIFTINHSDVISQVIENKELISENIEKIKRRSKVKKIAKEERFVINFLEFIEIIGLQSNILKIVNDKYCNLLLIYREKCSFIENEEKKTNMLNF